MRGCAGAIDKVYIEDGEIRYHVIEECEPIGICGSGLLDAAACFLKLGIMEDSGRLKETYYFTDKVFLNQKDIRELQLAKAAIAAGIEILCERRGVRPEQIDRLLIAGAFGNYLDPASACAIGMLPPALEGRIRSIGNAAGEGAQIAALSSAEFERSTRLAGQTGRVMTDLKLAEEIIREAGFSYTGILDVKTIQLLPEVREMCAEGKCGQYAKNWACPPHCGSLEECRERLNKYRTGILVQTVGELEDSMDWEGIKDAEEIHKKHFLQTTEKLWEAYPEMLPLGSGCCTLCQKCSCPDQPCRRPKQRISSMEAYGILISDICVKNQMKYYYGPNTIAYTACYLFS
jgi:predicted metal-binding protein